MTDDGFREVGLYDADGKVKVAALRLKFETGLDLPLDLRIGDDYYELRGGRLKGRGHHYRKAPPP